MNHLSNNVMPQRTAYCYFLVHASGNRFKIGKSRSIQARIKQIGQNEFDIGKSFALMFDHEDAAFSVERTLHNAFARWRFTSVTISRLNGKSNSGDTEWFDVLCFDRVMKFILDNKDLLGYRLIAGQDLISSTNGLTKPFNREQKNLENAKISSSRKKSAVLGKSVNEFDKLLLADSLLYDAVVKLEELVNMSIDCEMITREKQLRGRVSKQHELTLQDLCGTLLGLDFDPPLCLGRPISNYEIEAIHEKSGDENDLLYTLSLSSEFLAHFQAI